MWFFCTKKNLKTFFTPFPWVLNFSDITWEELKEFSPQNALIQWKSKKQFSPLFDSCIYRFICILTFEFGPQFQINRSLSSPPVFKYFTMDNFFWSQNYFQSQLKTWWKRATLSCKRWYMEGYKDLTLVVLISLHINLHMQRSAIRS